MTNDEGLPVKSLKKQIGNEIAILNLYHRNTDNTDFNESGRFVNHSYRYSVIGNFNACEIKPVKTFEELIGLSDDIAGIHTGYHSSQRLSLFKCDCEEKCNDISFEKSIKALDNDLVLVLLIKFDKSMFALQGEGCGTGENHGVNLLCFATRKIKSVIVQYSGVRFVSCASLGATDMVVFITSRDVGIYGKIMTGLRYIKGENDNSYIFSHMSSLYIYNYTNRRLLEPGAGYVSAELRCRMKIHLEANSLRERLTEILVEADKAQAYVDVHCRPGDEEITINVRTRFDRLMSLFINDTGNLSSDLFLGEFSRYIESCRTVIFSNESIDDKEPNLLTDIDVIENDAASCYELIYEKFKEYRYRIPKSVYYTVQHVMFITKNLISNKYKLMQGLKILKILDVFFDAISKKPKNVPISPSIKECIRDVSFILESSLQTDYANTGDYYEVLSANPFIKLYYAYEEFVRYTYTKMNLIPGDIEENKDRAPFIFMMIGYSHVFNSRRYFQDCEVNGGRSIISINIPNMAYLSLKQSYPYILHELGHYIRAQDRESRDMCYGNAVIRYLARKISEAEMDNGKLLPFEDALEILENTVDIAEGLNSNQIFDDYVDYISKEIKKALILYSDGTKRFKELVDAKKCESGCEEEELFYFRYKACAETLKYMLQKIEFLKSIADAFREAKSDLFMIEMGEYNLREYVDILYCHFYDNGIQFQEDNSFCVRFTSVFNYMLKRDRPEIDAEEMEKRKNHFLFFCDSDKLNFIKTILNKYERNKDIINELTAYLWEIDKRGLSALDLWQNYFAETMQRDDKPDSRKLSPENFNLNEEIGFYYAHWYNAMHSLYFGRCQNAR